MSKIIDKNGKVFKPMLPNLPTDNLYKFGFVGCIFLLSLIFFTRSSEKESLLKLKAEYDRDYFNTTELKNEFIDSKDSNATKKQEINKLVKKVNRDLGIIKQKITDFNSQSTFMNIIFTVCTLGSILFLWLWYTKLQKYQDIIIEKESKKE